MIAKIIEWPGLSSEGWLPMQPMAAEAETHSQTLGSQDRPMGAYES